MAGYGYEIRWEVVGETQLRRRLSGIALQLTDYREPLQQLADEVIYPEIRQQFEAQGNPPWPSLTSRYAARKARQYPGAGILVRTGDLKRSLTTKRARGSIYSLTEHQLVIGSRLRTPGGRWNLGLLHQKGAPRAKLPARPPLRLTPQKQFRAVEIFHRWLLARGTAGADREQSVGR